MEGLPTKLCTLCGEDCSKRRRARDSDGRYFCLKCFERRLEQVWKRRAIDEKLRASAEGMDDSMSSTFGMDVDLIASEAPTIAADDADTHPCPGCGQPTPRDVVICLNCGHNFEAGVQLRVERKVLSRERPAMWHTAIGLSCIVFGLGGAALHGVRLFRALPDAESAAGAVESFAFGTLALLALLLGTAGVLIAMQIEAGIVMLRCWIWTKLALCSAALLAGGAAVVMFASFLNRMTFMQAQGWRLDDAGGGISAIGFVLMLWLWQCAWPAAMLFFLEGEQVRKDIKDWSKPLVPSTALYED